ncbi:Uncharacterized protein FWK35_00020278 [Aphis craccivora]|uniref:Uncharacterized protein n=1 Tax=Aphis craccivora TaxID=307492 RepID=A0A6G0YA31_APHCR|nr:Uncharacterized protein FWK35_00020278 [Aphis craccivora]
MNVLILQCCVFFFFLVPVYSISCQNNASISNFKGGFRSEYPWVLLRSKVNIFKQFSKKSRKTKKK